MAAQLATPSHGTPHVRLSPHGSFPWATQSGAENGQSMFVKYEFKSQSVQVTVSMVAKWPPLSGKNKDVFSKILLLCLTHIIYLFM